MDGVVETREVSVQLVGSPLVPSGPSAEEPGPSCLPGEVASAL